MFNLESSIAAWREQMLAAGITSTDVDELEGHLREEIKLNLRSGQPDSTAFDAAMLNLGQPQPLSREYQKADGLLHRLSGPAGTRVERLLALGWLAYCAGSIYGIVNSIQAVSHSSFHQQEHWRLFALTLITGYIYVRCAEASLYVIFNSARRQTERRILWFLALLEVFGFGALITLQSFPYHWRPIFFFLLGLISLWLLRPTKKPRAAWVQVQNMGNWVGSEHR